MPYWDWARGESGGPVPDFFTMKMVDIVKPSGERYELWNPLYSFYFHPLRSEDFDHKVRQISAVLHDDTDHCSGASSMPLSAGPTPMHGTLSQTRAKCLNLLPSSSVTCTIISIRLSESLALTVSARLSKKHMAGSTASLVVVGLGIHPRATCGRWSIQLSSPCSCFITRTYHHTYHCPARAC
jgi:hypothetical protein